MLLVAFVVVEWKVAKLPMMPRRSLQSQELVCQHTDVTITVGIFRSTPVIIMMVQSFLFGAVYQSYLYYIPMYLQNAHQFSVMTSAGIYCALVAFQTLLSVLSGQYISRRGRYGEVIWFGFISWTLYV